MIKKLLFRNVITAQIGVKKIMLPSKYLQNRDKEN